MHAVLANPRPPLPVAAGTLGTAARALFLRAVTAGGALWTLLFFALWAALALLSGEPDVHDLRKPTEIVFPPPGPPLLPPPEPARPPAPVAPPHEIAAPVPTPGETPIPEAPEPPAPPDGDGRSGAG